MGDVLNSPLVSCCLIHIGYVTAEARKMKAERTLRLLEKLPEGDPHRLYHHIRALAGLRRFAEVPLLAERLAATIDILPPDVRVMWSQALLERGDPQGAIRILTDGITDHPEHPDLFYALLMAAGVGYTGSSLNIHRDHGLFGGVAVTLGRAPRVVEGLVHMGVLNPAVLDSEVMTVGIPAQHEAQDNPAEPGSSSDRVLRSAPNGVTTPFPLHAR